MKMLLQIAALLLSVLILRPVNAEPTEQSLISAWEETQKSDPRIKKFEKLESGNYRFSTDYFPFDGEIKIKEAFVDDSFQDMPGLEGALRGTVSLDLPGISEAVYSRSGYIRWLQGNSFYYSQEENRWLTSKEYFKQFAEQSRATCSLSGGEESAWRSLILWSPVLFLLLVLLLLLGRLPKAMKRVQDSQALAQKAVSISEDSNRLLREILETLRNKKE